MKIFITGGTSGLGLALATLYLQDGHHVGICGRNLTKLPDGITKNFQQLRCYEVDITEREAVKRAVQEFTLNNGLDVMIANAGRSHGTKTSIPDFGVSADIIKVNMLGVLYAFEAALESMLPQKHGHLVAIASVAGFLGLPGAGAYCASKAGVITLCESLAIDLKRNGIAVTAICPGFIDTPLTQQNEHPMPFLMSAAPAAQRIKRAIEKRKTLYLFPKRMQAIIYVLATMPRWLYRMLMRIPTS
ncbi:MAG: SDR family NAD(P)-dependent oxidoreductase [Nitrospirales bacterium]|nr:SDR family NAD(P)-dependent oxidoreductase [Nitrospirales bacterium]